MSAAVPVHLDLIPYRLVLTRPWTSARGRLAARCGWLVVARAQGTSGYGDCAPLPAAGTEAPAAAWRRLAQAARTGPRPALERPLDDAVAAQASAARSTTPAADFALECARCDLASRLAGISLRRRLARSAGDAVPVNAALGPVMETTPADLAGAALSGFRVVKLKVGIAAPHLELERLRALAATLPAGLRLRLDANGAWDAPTAARVIATLGDLPVESLEEPLQAPDWPTLRRLQSRCPFPLALDESVAAQAEALAPAQFPVRRIILKPAAIGGLRRTLRLARRLQGAGIEVVITSLVESAAGLWPTAQLAAAIGSPIPQGLATAAWLVEDLGTPPPIRDGHLDLPAYPGSGFTPDDGSAVAGTR